MGEIIALFIFGIWIVGFLAFSIYVFLSTSKCNAAHRETIEEDELDYNRKIYTHPLYSEHPENMWHISEDL